MKRLTSILLPAALALTACGPDTSAMPEPAEGQMLFAENCAACHGADAKGGAAAGAPDLTRLAARNGGAMPRAAVLSQIDGYGKVHTEEAMPEFGALLAGEAVPVEVDGVFSPVPRTLAALLTYLESIQEL